MFATGAAFASEDSPELLSERYSEPMNGSELLALEEHDVIYIYPMEVSGYYLLIPSESSELPG